MNLRAATESLRTAAALPSPQRYTALSRALQNLLGAIGIAQRSELERLERRLGLHGYGSLRARLTRALAAALQRNSTKPKRSNRQWVS